MRTRVPKPPLQRGQGKRTVGWDTMHARHDSHAHNQCQLRHALTRTAHQS